jgi:hypothetical protein
MGVKGDRSEPQVLITLNAQRAGGQGGDGVLLIFERNAAGCLAHRRHSSRFSSGSIGSLRTRTVVAA